MRNFEKQLQKMTIAKLATLMSSRCDSCPFSSHWECFKNKNKDKSCHTLISEWLQKEYDDYE